MLYLLQNIYINDFRILRIFNSIALRSSIAFIISFFFMLILCKPFIKFLKKVKITDTVREDGPNHQEKTGTPTMGGVLIMLSILFSMLIAGNFQNKYTIFLFFITIPLSLIGFIDDYIKFKGNKKGLSAKMKIVFQLLIVFITFLFIYNNGIIMREVDFSLVNPFIKRSFLYIGPFLFFIFMIFVIIGSSNAVNLTDGLDGLVSGPLIMVFTTFMFISYLVGNIKYATYLNLYYVLGAGEITVFISAVIGGILGFLWFNFHPAEIFMGDTGSLALGGLLGIIAIFLKLELLLPIIGIIFIIEAMSVIIQVLYFKKYKKRVFLMAPIHHHFEKLGLKETKVTIRFLIVTLLTCLLGIVILKLR